MNNPMVKLEDLPRKILSYKAQLAGSKRSILSDVKKFLQREKLLSKAGKPTKKSFQEEFTVKRSEAIYWDYNKILEEFNLNGGRYD